MIIIWKETFYVVDLDQFHLRKPAVSQDLDPSAWKAFLAWVESNPELEVDFVNLDDIVY